MIKTAMRMLYNMEQIHGIPRLDGLGFGYLLGHAISC